jgi:predicted PolB exonuclease-like 3'-5' exonuclease
MEDYTEQRLINVLTLDIETLPSGNRLTVDEMRENAPKNYKKEDTIVKWCEENIENEYRGRSLDSLKGRILCIGMKYNDEEPIIIPYYKDERDLMDDFTEKLNSIGKEIYSCAIMGHNIRKFDLPWLIQRGFKYGLKDIIRLLPTDKFDKRLVDTNELFNVGVYAHYTKLKDMCMFLGVDTPKDDIDGSEVYDVFMKGELDRIYTYCKKDVVATYECYQKMLP